MIVEMRTYIVKPGVVPEYLRVYEAEGLEIQKQILGNLVGYFYTDIGPLNQIIHMWGYSDLADRAARRAELGKHPGWQALLGKLTSLILTQENKILFAAPFSPIK
jgi:hypothetical protein